MCNSQTLFVSDLLQQRLCDVRRYAVFFLQKAENNVNILYYRNCLLAVFILLQAFLAAVKGTVSQSVLGFYCL
jgi:hypothetical protein